MYLDLVFFDDLKVLSGFSKKFSQNFIVAKTFKNDFELKKLKEKLPEGFKLCHVLQSSNAQELKKFRQKVDFIAVSGKHLGRNKFAVSSGIVDFLLQPCSSAKPEFDSAICNLAGQNKVCISILFSEFLRSQETERHLLLKNYLFVSKLCRKYKVPVAFFSGARNLQELRAVKDLSSFACLLGFNREQALKAVRNLQNFLESKSKLEGFEVLE